MKTEVIWTALPAGMANGKLKLSVFVSHRLYGSDTTLKGGDYRDALTWAAKDFSFKVLVNGKPIASDVTITSKLRPKVWESFMKEKTPVKAYKEPAFAAINIQTLSTVHLASMVESVYQAALELHPTERLPEKTWMEQHLAPFAPLRVNQAPLRVTPRRALSTTKSRTQPKVVDANQQVLQLRKGLDTKLKAWRAGGVAPALDLDGFKLVTYEALKFHEPFVAHALAVVPKPDIDYHQALTALGSFPELLRSFGFVFDLEFAVPTGLGASGTIEVAPTYSPKDASTVDRAMKTSFSFVAAKGVFMPKPHEGSDIVGGMLAVGNESFFTTQIDLDATALKLADVATSFNITAVGAKANRKATLPSLRSAGLALHRNARAERVKEGLKRMATLKDAAAVVHYDDLIRGYRVDILDRGVWKSLCDREGNYRIGTQTVDETKEGWISTAMTSAPGDDGSGPKKLHECLWRWTGWSFSVERPGKHLDEQGNLVNETDDLHEHFKLLVKMMVPKGTLPSLRFGRRYKMRARAVDLAGNSLPVTTTSSGVQESEAVTYTRFDPVLSPGMYPSAEMSFGEGENHIVIRKFKNAQNSVKGTRRIVIPPEGGFSLCEQHGKFDLPDGRLDPQAYGKIIAPRDKAEPLKSIIKAPLSDMPYLVDPMVRGASITYTAPEFPNQKAEPENAITAFPGAWPKVGSITLNIKPTTGIEHPQPAVSPGTIDLSLRPGEVIEAQISSTTQEDQILHLGVPNWRPVSAHPLLKATSSKFIKLTHKTEDIARISAPTWRINPQTPAVSKINAPLTQGKVWLVTPDRDFTIVYATQIPEQDAALVPAEPKFLREIGGTSLIFKGARLGASRGAAATTLVTHAWSTDEVECWSAWTDDLDLIEEEVRQTEKRTTNGTAFKVLLEPDDFEKPLALKHEIGDTKHHEITYLLRAHSRFRNYFDPKWKESEFVRESPPIKFHAPSTAKPADLPLQYIIPTFEWSRKETQGGVQSKRAGNGLRVYIARPWFTTGNGERLAVILRNPDTQETPALSKFITVYGADPIFGGGSVPAVAQFAHFKGSVAAKNLAIAEVPGSQVAAATYPVEFDEERQLWYADLEIDFGGTAYTPFLKLALARYQEHSIPGYELGRVVVADFMQLEPNRAATVTWIDDQKSFRVTLSGVTAKAATVASQPNRVVIGSVEEQGGRDADGAWRPVFVNGEELEGPVPFVGALGAGRVSGGEFTLPASRGSKNYRLVLREFEVFLSDFPEAPEAGAQMLMSMKFFTNRRLIYMDVIALTER